MGRLTDLCLLGITERIHEHIDAEHANINDRLVFAFLGVISLYLKLNAQSTSLKT